MFIVVVGALCSMIRSVDVACGCSLREFVTVCHPVFPLLYASRYSTLYMLSQSTVFRHAPSTGCPAIDVAVVDDLCPSNAAVRLKSMHVPMVTACWLVQCLINNQIMVFDGHPDYVCRV